MHRCLCQLHVYTSICITHRCIRICMCMHMYICICQCVCVLCICIFICVLYKCKCVSVFLLYVYLCAHKCMHLHMYMYIFICTCTCIILCICICICIPGMYSHESAYIFMYKKYIHYFSMPFCDITQILQQEKIAKIAKNFAIWVQIQF